MGINGLLPALKPIAKSVHVSKYKGQKAAVDGYSWLHKGAYCCAKELCQGVWTDKFVTYFLSKVQLLRSHDIEPIIIFDGGRLPIKGEEESLRHRARKEAREKAAAHLAAGNVAAAVEWYQRCVNITPAMAKQVIEELKAQGVHYIVAPYEADAQMAYLARKGDVQVVITEDSDLLAYACPRVLYKLDRTGAGEEVCTTDLPACHGLPLSGFTSEQFLQLCIMAGCDFLAQLPGIGLKKAHGMLRKYRSFTKVVKMLRFNGTRVPPEYEKRFQLALWAFRHCRVYCPQAQALVHLAPLPAGGLNAADVDVPETLMLLESQQQLERLDFLGPAMPDEVARGIATGHLDPNTHQPYDLPAIYAGCKNPPPLVAAQLAQQQSPQCSIAHPLGLNTAAGSGAACAGSGGGSGSGRLHRVGMSKRFAGQRKPAASGAAAGGRNAGRNAGCAAQDGTSGRKRRSTLGIAKYFLAPQAGNGSVPVTGVLPSSGQIAALDNSTAAAGGGFSVDPAAAATARSQPAAATTAAVGENLHNNIAAVLHSLRHQQQARQQQEQAAKRQLVTEMREQQQQQEDEQQLGVLGTGAVTEQLPTKRRRLSSELVDFAPADSLQDVVASVLNSAAPPAAALAADGTSANHLALCQLLQQQEQNASGQLQQQSLASQSDGLQQGLSADDACADGIPLGTLAPVAFGPQGLADNEAIDVLQPGGLGIAGLTASGDDGSSKLLDNNIAMGSLRGSMGPEASSMLQDAYNLPKQQDLQQWQQQRSADVLAGIGHGINAAAAAGPMRGAPVSALATLLGGAMQPKQPITAADADLSADLLDTSFADTDTQLWPSVMRQPTQQCLQHSCQMVSRQFCPRCSSLPPAADGRDALWHSMEMPGSCPSGCTLGSAVFSSQDVGFDNLPASLNTDPGDIVIGSNNGLSNKFSAADMHTSSMGSLDGAFGMQQLGSSSQDTPANLLGGLGAADLTAGEEEEVSSPPRPHALSLRGSNSQAWKRVRRPLQVGSMPQNQARQSRFRAQLDAGSKAALGCMELCRQQQLHQLSQPEDQGVSSGIGMSSNEELSIGAEVIGIQASNEHMQQQQKHTAYGVRAALYDDNQPGQEDCSHTSSSRCTIEQHSQSQGDDQNADGFHSIAHVKHYARLASRVVKHVHKQQQQQQQSLQSSKQPLVQQSRFAAAAAAAAVTRPGCERSNSLPGPLRGTTVKRSSSGSDSKSKAGAGSRSTGKGHKSLAAELAGLTYDPAMFVPVQPLAGEHSDELAAAAPDDVVAGVLDRTGALLGKLRAKSTGHQQRNRVAGSATGVASIPFKAPWLKARSTESPGFTSDRLDHASAAAAADQLHDRAKASRRRQPLGSKVHLFDGYACIAGGKLQA